MIQKKECIEFDNLVDADGKRLVIEVDRASVDKQQLLLIERKARRTGKMFKRVFNPNG
jgi:hypothetical protein